MKEYKKYIKILLCVVLFFLTGCVKQENQKNEEYMGVVEKEIHIKGPYIFKVRNLDEVRLKGMEIQDFYITNTGNRDLLLYVHNDNKLYGIMADLDIGQKEKEYMGMSFVAEDVIHVDCSVKKRNYFIYVTKGEKLFGIGKEADILMTEEECLVEPKLLMNDVKYALCGESDILVLKNDNTLWTWGIRYNENGEEYVEKEPVKLLDNVAMITGKIDSHAAILADGTLWVWGNNAYNICGIDEPEFISDPICIAENIEAAWMGKLQFNAGCLNWSKWKQYWYDTGYRDNLMIRKKDGSLWTCGKNIEGISNTKEQDGIIYSYEFVPCQVIQEEYITYDGIETYQTILQEYEQAWNDENYGLEKWKNVADSLSLFKGKSDYILCYSVADLMDDGTQELIIGLQYIGNSPYIDLHPGEYSPRIIYSYDGGMIHQTYGDMERRLILYQKGVIKELWGAGGRGYHTYIQLQKDSGLMELITEVSVDLEGRYYQRIDGGSIDDEIEITEERFESVRNQYETEEIELEWKSLEGFWNSDIK